MLEEIQENCPELTDYRKQCSNQKKLLLENKTKNHMLTKFNNDTIQAFRRKITHKKKGTQ